MKISEKDYNILKEYFPFNQIKKENLIDFLLSGEKKIFKKGEIIFKEEEPGNYFCIILNGAVRISTIVPGVGEETLSILHTGDFFGEMALIDEVNRSATALAHQDSEILLISKEAFNKIVSRNNPSAYWMLLALTKKLSHRLRETNEKLKAIFTLVKEWEWKS